MVALPWRLIIILAIELVRLIRAAIQKTKKVAVATKQKIISKA